MKKIMSVMLGLSLVTGTVAFAQEKSTVKRTDAKVTHNTKRTKGKTNTKITRGNPK
jgi:hypothetical protein